MNYNNIQLLRYNEYIIALMMLLETSENIMSYRHISNVTTFLKNVYSIISLPTIVILAVPVSVPPSLTAVQVYVPV